MISSISSVSSALTRIPTVMQPVTIALSSKSQTKQAVPSVSSDIAPMKQTAPTSINLHSTINDLNSTTKINPYVNSRGQMIGTNINVMA